MKIQFVLDYRSPYAYLANTQTPGLGAPITCIASTTIPVPGPSLTPLPRISSETRE